MSAREVSVEVDPDSENACDSSVQPIRAQSRRPIERWWKDDDAEAERLEALRLTGLLDSSPEEAFDRVSRLAARLLRSPTALISFVDDTRQFVKSGVGFGGPFADSRQVPVEHSFCKYVVRDAEPLIIPNTHEHPVVSESFGVKELGVGAYAGVPLITSDNHALGVICVFDGVPRDWSEEDVATLRDLAASVVTEIELRKKVKEEQDARALLDNVVAQAGDGIVVVRKKGEPFIYNPAAAKILGQLGPGSTLSTWAERNELFCADGITNYRVDELPMRRALRGEPTEQAVIGLRLPGDSELTWLCATGRPLDGGGGVVIFRDITVQKRQEARLADLSIKDELTSLYNRRGLVALAEQQLCMARRKGTASALFFVDLNGMKAINDRLGHEAGDAALIDTAAVLRTTFRESDVVARLGGDEFVVFAPEVLLADVPIIVDRLRRRVDERNASTSTKFSLSLSIGMSHCDAASTRTVEAMLAEADARMYEEKQQRRKRNGASMHPVPASSQPPSVRLR